MLVPEKKCFHVPKQHCENVPAEVPVSIPKVSVCFQSTTTVFYCPDFRVDFPYVERTGAQLGEGVAGGARPLLHFIFQNILILD